MDLAGAGKLMFIVQGQTWCDRRDLVLFYFSSRLLFLKCNQTHDVQYQEKKVYSTKNICAVKSTSQMEKLYHMKWCRKGQWKVKGAAQAPLGSQIRIEQFSPSLPKDPLCRLSCYSCVSKMKEVILECTGHMKFVSATIMAGWCLHKGNSLEHATVAHYISELQSRGTVQFQIFLLKTPVFLQPTFQIWSSKGTLIN